MHKLSETVNRKFEDVVEIQDGWCIETDTGWEPISKIMKTVPYEEWNLTLSDGSSLVCADEHIIFDGNLNEIYVKDLMVGDTVMAQNGVATVTSCYSTGVMSNMFDIQVDSTNHRYYANGILHHNTTTAGAYLLWKAMFEPDTQILIAANKFVQAMEIMDRIRYGYEECPDHIRAGVVEYNKGTIKFDNGSRITARATTPDAGRGLSITLLYLDEFAFVRPNMASEFWTSIQPVLSTGGGCIITSTPKNDEDQFAQIWRAANDNLDDFGNTLPNGVGRNDFFPIKVKWDEHPDRDEAWAAPFRNSLGEARFRQEFECCVQDTQLNMCDATGKNFDITIGDLYTELCFGED
jgi:hypothetical protein